MGHGPRRQERRRGEVVDGQRAEGPHPSGRPCIEVAEQPDRPRPHAPERAERARQAEQSHEQRRVQLVDRREDRRLHRRELDDEERPAEAGDRERGDVGGERHHGDDGRRDGEHAPPGPRIRRLLVGPRRRAEDPASEREATTATVATTDAAQGAASSRTNAPPRRVSRRAR